MIRSLRDRHRVVTTALAVILPIVFLAVLAARPVAREPLESAAADGTGLEPVGPAFSLLVEPRIEGRLLALPGDSVPRALQVIPSRDPAIPDLLAYLAPAAGDGGSLPPGAVLLGALRGSRVQVLPFADGAVGGVLVLYSQGWNRVLASVRLSDRP